jgi:hypothetical protein
MDSLTDDRTLTDEAALTDDQLGQFFQHTACITAGLDLIYALRDPIVKDDPMFQMAKRLGWVKSWTFTPAGLAGVKRAEATFVPLVQAYLQRQRDLAPGTFSGVIGESHGIPEHDVDGLLPPGFHHAAWSEFVQRFAHTERRYMQTQGLLAALHLLKQAGCSKAHIGGSFITAKLNPGDIDYVYMAEGMDLSTLDPMLHPVYSSQANNQRATFGLDGGCYDLDYVRQHLQTRSVIDRSELCTISEAMKAFLPLPTGRLVGSIVLDLSQELPPATDFHPSCMWDSFADRFTFLTRH